MAKGTVGSREKVIPFLYDNITLFRRSGRSDSETRLFIVSCRGSFLKPIGVNLRVLVVKEEIEMGIMPIKTEIAPRKTQITSIKIEIASVIVKSENMFTFQ